MLNPFRILATLLGFLVLATPIAAVAFFFVAIAGSPGTCEDPERPIESSIEQAAAFDIKWNALNAALDAGQPSSATFTEGEVTSAAEIWLATEDAPIANLRICFQVGVARASGKIDIPFVPGDVDVLAEGTLFLTDEFADAHVDKLEVGGLLGPLNDLVENMVNRVINDQTEKLPLQHDYAIAFSEGEVTVSGTP
jgi:hypothetical protein